MRRKIISLSGTLRGNQGKNYNSRRVPKKADVGEG
jgi:hypothetical protein